MPVFPAQLSLDAVNSTTEGAEIKNTQGPFMTAGYFITGTCTGGVSVQLQVRAHDGAPWENLGVPMTDLVKGLQPNQYGIALSAARLVQTGNLTGTNPRLSGYILFMGA